MIEKKKTLRMGKSQNMDEEKVCNNIFFVYVHVFTYKLVCMYVYIYISM